MTDETNIKLIQDSKIAMQVVNKALAGDHRVNFVYIDQRRNIIGKELNGTISEEYSRDLLVNLMNQILESIPKAEVRKELTDLAYRAALAKFDNHAIRAAQYLGLPAKTLYRAMERFSIPTFSEIPRKKILQE